MTGQPTSGGILSTELGQRVLSAVAMLVVVVAITVIGGSTFSLLWTLISAILFYEWRNIVAQDDFDTIDGLAVVALFVGLILALAGMRLAGAAVILLLPLLGLINAGAQERSKAAWIWFGAAYSSILAFTLPVVRGGASEGGLALVFFLFLVVWATDIVAYFAGRRFGGPKLMPKVSPKKTWSGALGGLAGAILIAFAFSGILKGIALSYLVVVAGLVSVISQAGDLFESWIKRRYSVKDSSNLIPGHGGFLDRLDGLIPASVPVAVYALLTMA